MASPYDLTSVFGGSQSPAADPFLPAIKTPFDSHSIVPEVMAAESPLTVALKRASRLTLVDGTTLSSDELAQSQSGAKLLAIATRTRPYDFLDAISDGGLLSWDFVPWIGQFASVGGSLYDAREASNAFRKMQRGESLSREEAIKATLFSAENEMKANGTWGSMVGSILRKAPAFFAEFGFTGSGMQALRSAVVTRAAGETTEAAAKFLTHAGVTRATKTGATELSEMFVKSAIKTDLEKGVFQTASQAAKAYMESPEFIARTAKATSAGVRDIMEKSAPYVTGVKQWAPGLADKVSDALSERAVRASLAHLSQDSKWLRFFDSSRRAIRNSVIEGLTDLGEWGTESATTVMTGASRASQAFAQAGLDLTFGAGSRGLAMFLPREAISRTFGAGMEAITGETPVRATTLGLEQAAWQNGDESLMSRAETYGMFLDLLEYVSESSGRGFNNLFRGAGLAAAPKLMRPAARIAGTLETKGATQLVRDSAGKITDVVYDVGLVDAARGAEVGGAMKRYIEKVAGGRSLKENVAADRLTAVTHKLSKMGVDVPDSAALSAALESGAVRGLDPAVARALGPDFKAFAKSAVREANHEGLRNMKLHGMLTYYVADFMARHNYDAARAFEKFTQMGYDGVIGEMMEERYSDVVSTLFGLDAEEKGFWDRVGTSVRRMFMPDGGLKQLLAEATGFAVPMVVRAGVMRTIAAMGSKNDFANNAAWASSVQDALHYGTIQNFRPGDYITRVAEQAKRLRDTAAEQRKQAGAEGVTDLQRRELTVSAEGYERAAVRAENLREAFLKTVDPSAEEFAAPVYSDADLTQTDAEFNQNVVPVTAQQATSALAGYRSTLEFAGKAGQLQYKALHRTNDEASHWFRRASHWVAEHALRLGGTLATGDFAFLSANPAAFAAADRGVSQSFLDSLQKAYGNVYEAALRELSTTEREGSGGARTVDTEAAHALALERFQPQAEQMMAHHLAAMQTYMFSHDELRDIALVAEAEKDGFMVDPERRRLVAEDGSSLSYSEYLARDGVSARVDSQVEHDAGLVYNLLTNSGATGATLSHELNGHDQNILLRRIVNIPKGLPTADQAVLATVLKYHPAFADTGVSGFRDVMVKTQLDPGKSVEDQLPGISTRKGHLKLVADVLTQGRTIQSPADFRDAVARIAEADPGIVELIGRDLGYSHSFTEASKRRRDEAVARYVLASTMFDDPETAVFTRSANINEDEQRVGSHFTEVVPVRHTARGWQGTFRKAQDGSVETIVRPTLDELEQTVSADEYGYSRHERRVVHTAVRTLYADTAQDVISSLNLGREYRERQDRIAAENPNNELLKDPALRKAADGTYQHTMEEARSVREREAREAAEFVAHGKQQDPALYLLPGESAKDSSAVERARARMERLRASYNSREARQKDGRALGYNAIAEDLVNAHGVRGGTSSRFSNEFGTADADLRNKFTVSLSALRGATGDVYIPIDHTTAQSYSSSMLSALLMDRVAMGRQYVKRTFASQIRDLLQTVEAIADRKIADATDAELKDRWTAFADAFVRGSKEGYRSTTPSTLNTFIQAFCLYRTEVPNSELVSTLGDFGGELKEIAAEVRRSPAFVPFCAAADFLLGGSGFETSVSGNGRGLATYYAMFAPHGAPGFQERVAESRGVDYAEFAGRAREAARMAFRDAAGKPKAKRPKTSGRERAPEAPVSATVDEAVAAAPDEAFPELEIAKAAIAEETGEDAVSMDEVMKFASMLGGNTAEQATADAQEETIDRTEEPPEEDLEELDDEGTRRGYYDVALDEPPKPFEVSEDGSRQVTVDYRDVKELTEDEAKAFAGVGRMLAEVLDPAYDLKSFREVIRKIVPGVRQKDLDQLTDAYNAEQGYYGDEEWAWSLDTDEEGIAQDGFENNNARNVEIIQKSPVIRRLLAIMSKVSPATGRDFQPLVEDLRSFASIAPTMFADRIAAEEAAGRTDLKDAIAFLDTLLNPRAQAYASACVREAAFNDMLDGFAPGVTDESGRTVANPKRDVIRRHIAAFMRVEGDAPVPCARAAVLFAYFAQLRNDNARRQLAQLIGSSAPSTPVRLETRRDAEGNLAFMIRAVNQRPGTLSSEAITSQFARWVDRPASELKAAADRLEKDFKAVQERLSYRTAADGRRMAPALVKADRTGLFDTYATVLARTFGSDAPVTVAFSSMRHVLAVRNNRVGNREAFLSKFVASDNGLPYAVRDLIGMMRAVAETAGDGNVPASVLEEAAIGLFQSGAPENRHVNYAQSSLMGRGAWSLLLRGYADTKPVTVMRAEIDPTRTNKPASSLAITMAGVEPVIQQFLDRTDERGFRAVVDKWFPKYAGKPIDRLRQRLAWPDSLGTGLVAKNIVKTAFATETLAGCRAAYEAEQNGPEGERTGMVYVPMFSGDHSSSIIIQVPLAKEFAAAGMSYDQVADMVCDWFGLDLFGTDAKRSAVTCLESPGVSLVGIVRDEMGNPVLDESGNPKTGTCTYGIVWNSAKGANNEAMLGTLVMFGYGATRIRQMARDPGSATLKVHVSAVGPDAAFGTMPTLTKALTVGFGPGDKEGAGQFLEGDPLRGFMDHAESGVGSDGLSTYILADYDSVKMDVLNSKMVGVDDGKGGVIPLMKYVFDTRLAALLRAGEKVDGLSGAELDEKIGDIQFVNLAKSKKPVSKKLSELVPDAKIRAVKGMEGVYTLERTANQLMAFQVANVSHKAKPETTQTARNYMTDALAGAHTIEDVLTPARSRLMPGVSRVANSTRRLVSSWGVLAAAIGHDEKSIDNMLAQDEEWLDAQHRGEPVGGPVYQQYRRKAYAAWVKSQLRTLPMKNIYSPLVSNCAWVDQTDGTGAAHPSSQMFRDTLQGARTIARRERAFWGAEKRVAICNVNNSDASFRYGMYIDSEKLMSHRDLAAYVSATPGEKGVVETLEAVITEIVKGGDTEVPLRLALAECLFDHHGKTLASRRYEQRLRDRKTGEVQTRLRRPALEISYLDLFTSIHSTDGTSSFDRAAVYTGMHDSEGNVRLYLGGTMFGLPRTPSYNGSMWLQVVRAGLPVTERLRDVQDEEGNVSGQWLAGTNAMVAPDPFTLKILGCDHDGDKANLYMLDPQGAGRLFRPDAKASREARRAREEGREEPEVPQRSYRFEEADLADLFREADAIATAVAENPDADVEALLAQYRQRLIDAGILQYEMKTERLPDGSVQRIEGRLQFAPQAAARLNNTWVQALFDMNRALPVPSREANAPFYAGTVVTDGNRGLMSRGTKATPSSVLHKEGEPLEAIPETATETADAWDVSVTKAEGTLAPKVLDAATGRTIKNVKTAAKVQTGAAFVSEARGRFVKAAGDMHLLYALGVHMGVTGGMSGQDFVDHMYHQDGPNNMSFDDMKEQICSRLGLLPGMVETFLYEYGLANGPSLTDAQANVNMARFARRVNDPQDLYHYLLRASDPSDTEFVDQTRGLGPATPEVDAFVNWMSSATESERIAVESAMNGDHGAGVMAFIAAQKPEGYEKAKDAIVAWRNGVGQISDASYFATAVNYTKVDPGDPYAGGTASRQAQTFLDTVKPVSGRRGVQVDRPVELNRMFAASQLLLGGPGSVVAARGVKSVSEYRTNVRDVLDRLGSDPAKAVPTHELSLVVAAQNSPRLRRRDRLQAAGNAYMVGAAAAQFLNTKQIPGSPLNGDFYRKCAAVAEAVASVRHPAEEGRELSGGYANATLDFRYAVESMADLFSRLLASSTVGRQLPVFNYLVEYPDAGRHAYDATIFGPAASGVARVTLGLGDVTAAQLQRVQGYWSRIVDGRELDTDGVLGRLPYTQTTNRSSFTPEFQKRTISFEFSVANLETLAKYLQTQQGKAAFQQEFDSASQSVREMAQRSRAEGRSRNTLEDVQMLISVFKRLEQDKTMFPNGVHIQPSALFGQLLPAYAAITDFSEEAPGPGSHSLLALVPGGYRTQAEELKRILDNRATARALAIAEAINWAPVQAYAQQEYEDDARSLDRAAMPSRTEQARSVSAALRERAAVRRKTAKNGEEYNAVALWTADHDVRPLFVSGHRTLGVFDGTRGVAFSALLNCIKYGPAAELKLGTVRSAEAVRPQPAERPASPQPAERPVQQAPVKSGRPGTGYTMHSGGAIGSDHMWGVLGAPYGVKLNHYQKDKTPYGNVTITEDQYQEGFRKVQEAVVPLGRRIPSIPYVKGLLSRDWQQVKNADAVFAIAERFDGVHVHGGTGWAVQMAKGVGKPIHVFNQSDKTWYRWTGNEWSPESVPTLTQRFAGIGTRKLNSDGVQAIRDVYQATFGPLVDNRTLVGVARSLQTMFQAWNGTKVEYDPTNPAKFTILSNLQVRGQDPDARLFKTKIDVYLTKAGELADADVDKRLADANYMKSALARAGMTQERFDAMSLDEKRAFVRRSRATGVTQFKFDDAPGAFRVTTDDLETLTAKVTLDVGAKPVTSGTAFHEAFHAVMGFVRATGVLSPEDIAVLQKKYGKATVGGQEWFNEEPAAMDYQKLVSAELAPSPETKTPQGIWAKLKAFFTTLLDAIRGAFGEGHRAEDYGNEMRENPLMQIMLTGIAEFSRREQPAETQISDPAILSRKIEQKVLQQLQRSSLLPDIPWLKTAFRTFVTQGASHSSWLINSPVTVTPGQALSQEEREEVDKFIDQSWQMLHKISTWKIDDDLERQTGVPRAEFEEDKEGIQESVRDDINKVVQMYLSTVTRAWEQDLEIPYLPGLAPEAPGIDPDIDAYILATARVSADPNLKVTDGHGAVRQAAERALTMPDLSLLPREAMHEVARLADMAMRGEVGVNLGKRTPVDVLVEQMEAEPDALWVKQIMEFQGVWDAVEDKPVSAAKGPEPVIAKPNPITESTVAEILPAPDAGLDIPMDLTGVESVTEDQFNEVQYDVQLVLPRIRQALAGVDSNRMAVPYSDHELLAASLGAAIRDGFTEETLGNINRLTLEQESRYTQDQVARMRMAIGRIADLYGVTVPAEREAILFKGLCQLGVNIANAYQCAAAPEINLHLKPGKPKSKPTRSRVSSAQLAAAMATASGVLPSDMVEAALYDVRQIADRRGRGNAFTDYVLDGKLIPMLEGLMRESADPVGLLERFNEDMDAPNELMSSLLAGLVAEKDADGYRTGFRLADINSSDNLDSEANRSLYADHIDDPDFQKAVGTVADTLYMLAASRNMYRDLGFTPGRPTDAAAFPAYDGTAKSPMEMAVDLGSMPEQYVDPAHESVSFFDQAWFVAESPKMWLDSMLAESFGKVGLRESMQGLHAEIAGYQNRIVALRNLHAYEYGLSDLAGVNLLEVDEGYDSGFEWKDGRIVHGERETPENVRRYKNGTKTRTKVSLTLNEQRVIDMVLKARRVWLAGGRKVITGVDGLTFSLDDSADPAYYSRENVAKRVGMGYGRGESDIDRALYRLDLQLRDDPRNGNFDWIVESGDGRYGLRDRLVNGICTALGTAGELVRNGALERADVNDFVIQQLDREGLVNGVQAYRRNVQGARFVSAAVTLDADELEDLFLKSSAYAKLVQAGRKPAWLTREAYAQPYRDLWREVKSFVASRPFLTEGDGRFFHNVNSPVPFVRGSGVFMHEAARVERRAGAETANQVRTKYAETFENLLADPNAASTPAGTADADTLLMMRTMFHLPEQDVESIRRAIVSGDYADVRGLNITAASTVADIADAIYQRLVGMVWNRSDATGEAAQFGGLRTVTDLLEKYRERRLEDGSVLSGGSAGMSDEMVHRMTGVLPASHQLGHALQNAIDGILNAYAYRAAVINMATAPAEDGTPLCYVKPSLDAAETSGVPDDIWGSIARWQAAIHHLEYDPKRSGVENARNIYDKIVGSKEFDKSLYGSINPEEMDTRAIEGFWARKGVPEGESSLGELAGGYALGYAKHLFQATKALGGKYQRAIVHRAWAYSKAMSVSFSLFFPIATRFESPIGAVGALATIGGNISSDALRKHAAELQKIWGALRGKGWITKDFIGETDFVKLLDSNDPFLSEMYRYASAIGLTLSNTNTNVIEHSRGILMQDLKNLTNYVHDKFGAKAAKRVDAISKAVFVRGSEKAFAYHLNATKLAVAAQMCMKLQAEAASRGVMFDPVRDLRRYSSYINSEVGGIDPMSYAWAHPKMQNLMNTLFFSWNWTRGAWEAGGGKVIEKLLFGGHDVTPEETRFLIGRAVRMWGWIAFGLPQMVQIICNGLACMIDPDDDDDIQRDMKWFIWENEDKAAWKSCDLTPLMRAIGKRFPWYAKFRKEHPFLSAAPTLAFMVSRNPWITGTMVAGALPVSKEPDKPQRHTYFHLGKQAWEFYNWFDDPVRSFFSKLSMPIQRVSEGVLGRSLTSLDYKQPWADMGAVERWVTPTKDSALFNLGKAFIPFSLSGMTDMGTDGLLPILGPTSHGASKYAITKELEKALDAWSSNDRRGYAFGGPLRRFTSSKAGKRLMQRNVNVRSLVATAVANGHVDERTAYELVDAAAKTVATKERKRLIEMVPETPDGDYDVKAWSASVRKLQRLGVLGKDLRDSLVKRLKEQKRWRELTEEQRREMLRILGAVQRDPYGVKPMDY